MSASVCIDPSISSIAFLLEAIESLGIAVQDLKKLEDCHGKQVSVDLLVEVDGQKIGIRGGDAKGAIQFVVTDESNKAAFASVNRIKQAYVRVTVLDEIRRKGYTSAKEEKLPDGSIRIVAQKWQ